MNWSLLNPVNWFRREPAVQPEAQPPTAAAEALGTGTQDPDNRLPGNQNQALFSAIGAPGGESGTDPSRLEYRRLLRLIRRAYRLNGVPANLVNLTVDFIIGEGFGVRAVAADGEMELSDQEQKLDELLRDWWTEETNDLEREHEGIVTLLVNEGQYLLPVRGINPVDGHVLLGHEPNDFLEQVVLGPTGKPTWALLRDPKGSAEMRRFYLLNSATPEDDYTFSGGSMGKEGVKVRVSRQVLHHDGTLGRATEDYDGIGFFFSRDRVRGGTAGWPLLGPIIDYANIHDEIVWTFAERAKALHKYLIHATFEGKQEHEIPELLKAAGLSTAPETGKVIGSNQGMKLEMLSPSLQGKSFSELERTLRMIMAGSLGYPEAWTGSGEDVNRATLVGQNTVTFKRLRRVQKSVLRGFRMVADFQIDQWRKFGVLPAAEAFEARYEFVRTSLDDKDRGPMADALQKLVIAVSAAVGSNVIPLPLAKKVLVQVLTEFGFEVTPEDLEEAGDEAEMMSAALDRLRATQGRFGGPGGEQDAGDDEGSEQAGAA